MTVDVVTGAASGMGLACAERLAGVADHLVVVDLDATKLEKVAAGLGATPVVCDITDRAAVASLVEQVNALGPFRGLAHAAGISPTMADPRRVLDVDLVGTAILLEALRPVVGPGSAAVIFASVAKDQLVAAGDPVIDAIIDDPLAADFLDRAGEHITDGGMAYGWAKRGVARLARREAVVWGPKGGRVNSLSPGLIDTPMNALEFDHQPMMKVMLDKTPAGRFGKPEEIAATVAFLLSPDAGFISGVDVIVDGALLAGLAAAFS